MNWKTQHGKDNSFPIFICRFNSVPIKIPKKVCKHRQIINFISKGTDPRIPKTILRERNKHEESVFLKLEAYYVATVTKTVMLLVEEETHTSIEHNREPRNTSTQIYASNFCTKVQKHFNVERITLPTNGAGVINSKWIMDWNIKTFKKTCSR